MASSVRIILDTTPPEIEIRGINHAQQGLEYEFTILSNEPIDASQQEVAITDYTGYSEQVICEISEDGKKLTGRSNLANFHKGIIRIAAWVTDEVWNRSNQADLSITLYGRIAVCCMSILERAKVRLGFSNAVCYMSILERAKVRLGFSNAVCYMSILERAKVRLGFSNLICRKSESSCEQDRGE